MQSFELRPAYEDVLRPETASVEDYLRRVHETIAASAVQEAQRATVEAFERHMDAHIAASWTREKRILLDAVEPFSAPIGVSYGAPGKSKTFIASGRPEGGAMLRGRAGRYADIVRKLNASLATGQRYEAIDDFVAAAAAEDRGGASGESRTTMLRVWQVLQRQIQSSVYDLPASARTQRTSILLSGARGYLEDNFVAYMQNVVNTHRAQAALGGNPSRLALVQGYLRVRERDRGALDFDQSVGGLETSWLQIYSCLRAGFVSEAVQVATTSAVDALTPRPTSLSFTPGARSSSTVGTLSALLRAWEEGGRRPLTGDLGTIVTAECDRLLRDREARTASPHFPQRAMIYALLAGSNRAADALAREYPSIFPTIEDFLWLKLGLIRLEQRSVGLASSGLEWYSLQDFQKALQQYPASHYSHNGREPLLYAVVLLLSLQSTAAVNFLARDPSTRDVRLDSVHVGICLWHANVIPPGGSGVHTGVVHEDPLSDSKDSVGGIIHQYAHSLVHGDVALALEYYMLAAAAMGGSLGVRGALLKELLSESKAYGLLLGSGGAGSEGGALSSLIPDPEERRKVLEAVAAEYASDGQMEEGAELFMAAERPRAALVLLTERLSEEIEAAASDPAKNEEADALAARAQAAAEAIRTSQDPADIKALEAFAQVKVIRSMLAAAARGDKSQVLQALAELAFLPTDQYRFQSCVAGVANLSRAVASRIQAVVLAAAEALADAGKREELRLLVAFAASVPNRLSQAAYQRLNQWNASLS